MKKIIATLFIGFSFFSFNPIYALNFCTNEEGAINSSKSEYFKLQDQYNNTETDIREKYKGTGATEGYIQALIDSKETETFKLLTKAYNAYNDAKSMFSSCTKSAIDSARSLFNNGSRAYERGDYISAIDNYKKYLEIVPTESSAKGNLVLSLNEQGDAYFDKSEYANALRYYNEALSYDNRNQKSLLYVGIMYYSLKDYPNAKIYLQKAYDVATDSNYIKIAKDTLNDINSSEQKAELLRKSDMVRQENIEKDKKIFSLKSSVDKWFAKVQSKYGNLDKSTRDNKYNSLLNALSRYEGRLSGDKKIILDYLVILVKNELGVGTN